MIYPPPLSTQLALLCLLPVGVRMLEKPGRGGKPHKRLPKIRGRLPDLEMNSGGSLALPCPLCPIPGHPGSPRGLAFLARVQNFPTITCSYLISPPTQERWHLSRDNCVILAVTALITPHRPPASTVHPVLPA